jgi:membrane-associated phospholipid phosphatase
MKWKPLFLSFGVIAFLWATFLSPWTTPLWNTLDTAVFKALNGTLEGNTFLQYFWGVINHKRMDLVEDVVFLLFFIWGVKEAPRGLRWKKTAEFIAVILLASSVIFFINRNLLRYNVFLPRESPSLVVSPCVKITDEIPWEGLKDETIASFPGDHATTLLLFGFLFSAFASKRLSKAAWIYILFRSLPRLVVGAHWLSDIAVGSMTIALFFAACFLYTPLGRVTISMIERLKPKKAVHGAEKKPL